MIKALQINEGLLFLLNILLNLPPQNHLTTKIILL